MRLPLLLASFVVLIHSTDINFANNCNSPITLMNNLHVLVGEIPVGGSMSISTSSKNIRSYVNGTNGLTQVQFNIGSALLHQYTIDVEKGFDVAVQVKPTAILAPAITCRSATCAQTVLNPNGTSKNGVSLLGGNYVVLYCPPE